MADEINGGEVLIFLAEVMQQSCNLAGGSREEDLSPLFQERFGFLIGSACARLYIFTAHKRLYIFHSLGVSEFHLPFVIKSCSKNHPSFRDRLLCQQIEDATRGTVHVYLFVLVEGCINIQRLALFIGMQFMADSLAEPASDAICLID